MLSSKSLAGDFTLASAMLALACILASGIAQASAGKAIFVSGKVLMQRSASTVQMEKGTELQPGDLIVTGDNGRVQLMMQDGDRIALRPNTRFHIDEFKEPASPSSPGTGIGFYSLLKGGFQALTRSLGMRNESSYRVVTPVATIGIRGTHYNVLLCENVCSKPGLYLGVLDGAIQVHNTAGSLELHKNQFGYVANANTAPVLINNPPPVLNDDNPGGTNDGSVGSDLSIRRSPAPSDDQNPDSGNGPDGNEPPNSQPIQGHDPSGQTIDLTPGTPPPVTQPKSPFPNGG